LFLSRLSYSRRHHQSLAGKVTDKLDIDVSPCMHPSWVGTSPQTPPPPIYP
jgi:hypothetical protein